MGPRKSAIYIHLLICLFDEQKYKDKFTIFIRNDIKLLIDLNEKKNWYNSAKRVQGIILA